jgi:hypothetical protein
MAKKFKAKLTQTIYVEFSGDKASEKSAEYVVKNIARCHYREGWSKNVGDLGKFTVIGESDAEASDVSEIIDIVDSGKKRR